MSNNDNRFGRVIGHSPFVTPLDAVFSNDEFKTYRYRLDIDLNREGEHRVVVILKNPSSATKEQADITVRRVEDFVLKNIPTSSQLTIVNLFAVRGTYTGEVESRRNRVDLIGPDNDHHILEACEGDNTLIIRAWGGPSAIDPELYFQRVEKVNELLSNFNNVFDVKGKKVTGQPLHGMIWGLDYELKKVS